MGQVTVKQLWKVLGQAIKEGHGDKYIVISDDNEGNGYHGMFYELTTAPTDVADLLEDDLYDSAITDPAKLVILG